MRPQTAWVTPRRVSMRPRQRPSSTLAGDYRSGDKTCGEVLSAFRNMELAQVVLFFFCVIVDSD